MEEFESIKASGANVHTGKRYKDISVAGATKFTNDFECSTFKSSGALKVEGSVKAVLFKAAGAVKILGGLDATEISVSGGATILKELVTDVAKFSGSLEVGGNVSAKELHISGSIENKNEVLADVFELKLSDRSILNEIYGDEVTIERAFGFGFGSVKKASVNLIEATQISLEYTTCKKVSGDIITIGEGCDIDTVEYTKSLDIHKKAKVKNQVKID